MTTDQDVTRQIESVERELLALDKCLKRFRPSGMKVELIKGQISIEVAIRQLIVRMLNFDDDAIASNDSVKLEIDNLYNRVGTRLVATYLSGQHANHQL